MSKKDEKESERPKGKEGSAPVSEEVLQQIAETKRREGYRQQARDAIGGIRKVAGIAALAILALATWMYASDSYQKSVLEKQDAGRRAADARVKEQKTWNNCVRLPVRGSTTIIAKPGAPSQCYVMEYGQMFRFDADQCIEVRWINGRKTSYCPGTITHLPTLDNPAFKVVSASGRNVYVTVRTEPY